MATLLDTTTMNLTSTGIVTMNASPATNTSTRPLTGLAAFAATIMSITANTTLSTDSNLSITINETGVYTIDGLIGMYPTGNANGACGFQMDLGGGSATVNTIRWSAVASNGVTASGTTVTSNAMNSITTPFKLASIGNGANVSNSNWVQLAGVMTINVTGTFIPRWAQNGSTVNVLNRAANSSYLLLKKIG